MKAVLVFALFLPFAVAQSAEPLPEGIIPYQKKREARPNLNLPFLKEGQQNYSIYCEVCHGIDGQGEGMAVLRGFPKPPNLTENPLLQMASEQIFSAAKNGFGRMYGFANRIPDKELWSIVAYLRALQLSQGRREKNP
jgi:cytochrome c553